MAEDIATHLQENGIKAHYLHSDVKTLERTTILDDLRNGTYDALIGINLLREGLDLPEVSLVAILDADKEGFLRSSVTLIQTMGRAARHAHGEVIMYADTITRSMETAIKQVDERRNYQLAYNQKHHIVPQNIIKPRRERMAPLDEPVIEKLISDLGDLTPMDQKQEIKKLKTRMKEAAQNLDFETAIYLRDEIKKYEQLS
jgi:excinuclease ABC subunit B